MEFLVDPGAENTCISINSLRELGYSLEDIQHTYNHSDHHYIYGCTGDVVEAFKLDVGEIMFNGFKLSNFPVTVINPINYEEKNDKINMANNAAYIYGGIINSYDYIRRNVRLPYDLPNILGTDILKYFIKEVKYPYYNRHTNSFSDTGGYMHIRLAPEYYEEFKDEKIIGSDSTPLNQEYISFEETFNPTYVDIADINQLQPVSTQQVVQSKSQQNDMFQLPDVNKIINNQDTDN